MKTILNNFRALPLAHKCVVLVELLALALLPFFIGPKQAQRLPQRTEAAIVSPPGAISSTCGK